MTTALKLDYEFKPRSIHNNVLSCSCQRCGQIHDEEAIKLGLCPSCRGENMVEAGGERQVSGWHDMLIEVTTRGCDVFVNGVFKQSGTSAIHAGLIKKALEKFYMRHNLDIKYRLLGIRRK